MGINRTNPQPRDESVQIWSRTLRVEALLEDIFTSLRGNYSANEGSNRIGNDIYLDIAGEGINNARLFTMLMHKALSGAPVEGSIANPVGQEEDLINKLFTIRYTDWSHAVSLQSYGIERNTKDYYGLFERINPDMSTWIKEQEGKYIREAYLETFSSNLTQAPHFLTQDFNSNIAIAGLHSSQWPVYSLNPATWTNRIAAGLNTAGVGAQSSCTIRFLQLVEEWASAERTIEPVMIDGKETYLAVIPSPQARYMRDPLVAGNAGTSGYQDVVALTAGERMLFPWALYRFGKLLIVVDMRYPTLTLGGTAGNFTLASQYKLPGRDPLVSDPRDKSMTAVQVGFLLGRAGMAKWQPEKWHYEWEYEQYDKFGGKGAFNSSGYTAVRWQYGPNDTVNVPLANTLQNDSSAIMLFRQPPLLT